MKPLINQRLSISLTMSNHPRLPIWEKDSAKARKHCPQTQRCHRDKRESVRARMEEHVTLKITKTQ